MNGASASQLPGGEGPCQVAPGVPSSVVQTLTYAWKVTSIQGRNLATENKRRGRQGWADVTCEWNISPCQACVNADGLTQAIKQRTCERLPSAEVREAPDAGQGM